MARIHQQQLQPVGELFSPREVVELLLLIGYFCMISIVMTALEVELDTPF
jgi:hypothetical protein